MESYEELREGLNDLRTDDLRALIVLLDIDDVRVSQSKSVIVDEILQSPTLQDGSILDRLREYAQFFLQGGRDTLTLFKTFSEVPEEFLDVAFLRSSFTGDREVVEFEHSELGKTTTSAFRFKNCEVVETEAQDIFELSFETKGNQRVVHDFVEGDMPYNPVAHCRCFIRPFEGFTILDARGTGAYLKNMIKYVTNTLWGEPYVPRTVNINLALANRLKTIFNARTFLLSVTDSDDLDEEGHLHPRSTSHKSENHDLDDHRADFKFGAAEDTAKGLAFDYTFNGLPVPHGCKISLNYTKNHIIFERNAPRGVYDEVIKQILENIPDDSPTEPTSDA